MNCVIKVDLSEQFPKVTENLVQESRSLIATNMKKAVYFIFLLIFGEVPVTHLELCPTVRKFQID